MNDRWKYSFMAMTNIIHIGSTKYSYCIGGIRPPCSAKDTALISHKVQPMIS